jgi:ATP-binding cassette subfamily E protein 1
MIVGSELMVDPSLPPADLQDVLERDVEQLSGGELQRFAIAVCCVQQADMYVCPRCHVFVECQLELRMLIGCSL